MHKCHEHHDILHTLCTWFGKNELRLHLRAKISSIGGRPSRPPLNMPMSSANVILESDEKSSLTDGFQYDLMTILSDDDS